MGGRPGLGGRAGPTSPFDISRTGLAGSVDRRLAPDVTESDFLSALGQVATADQGVPPAARPGQAAEAGQQIATVAAASTHRPSIGTALAPQTEPPRDGAAGTGIAGTGIAGNSGEPAPSSHQVASGSFVGGEADKTPRAAPAASALNGAPLASTSNTGDGQPAEGAPAIVQRPVDCNGHQYDK